MLRGDSKSILNLIKTYRVPRREYRGGKDNISRLQHGDLLAVSLINGGKGV